MCWLMSNIIILSLNPEFIYCDEYGNIIEIVLSETNEQDTNELSEGVSETQKKISFETALTALDTNN